MTDAQASITPTPHGLPSRLAECASRMGGKRALAKAAGLSEAQLFRYLNGESDMAISKLTALAGAANVSAAWLLTGAGDAIILAPQAPAEPSFNPTIMETLTQQLDELLVEYQTRLTPKQRARGLTFLYQALRHDELTHGHHTPIDRRLLLEVLEYYDHFKSEEMLNIFRNTWDPSLHTPYLAAQLSEMTTRASQNQFDGFSGKVYFNRVTTQITPASIKRLSHLVQEADPHFKTLRFLDMGTGNGRDLAFLHQHYPNLNLHGIDISKRGLDIAQQLVQSHRLPQGCLTQGDITTLPFASESFEILNCRTSLPYIPFSPHTGTGAEALFAEANRVLVPRGLMSIVTQEGTGRLYAPFIQYYSSNDIEFLAQQTGLRILRMENHDAALGLSPSSAPQNLPTNKKNRFIEILLQKTS